LCRGRTCHCQQNQYGKTRQPGRTLELKSHTYEPFPKVCARHRYAACPTIEQAYHSSLELSTRSDQNLVESANHSKPPPASKALHPSAAQHLAAISPTYRQFMR
jgi:hypothetical protein